MFVDDLLRASAEKRPENTVIAHGNRRASYGEVHANSELLAAALNEMGLRRGDRVVIALENSAEYITSYFGVIRAGCAAVAVNVNISTQSLLKIVADCAPKAIIARHAFFRKHGSSSELSELKSIIAAGPNESGIRSNDNVVTLEQCYEASPGRLSANGRSESDLAMIIYTSGTTGEPKGVMLSHRNLASNTASIISYLGLTGGDSVMVVLPFYYSYGNSLLLTHAAQGAKLVLENSFMYPNVVLASMAREEVTGFAGVPSTFAILCHRSNFKNAELPSLRYMTQAGGPMPHDMAYEIIKTVPHAKLYIMYGQTEASARLSYLAPEDLLRKYGSVGKAIPGVTLEVLNEAGEKVAPGETGEIVASGDNIMGGYWAKPEETSRTVRGNRLYTGDIATVDDEGYIYIVSRKTELIKSGGHRIAPREIEEVLLKDPRVFEAAVVGKKDQIAGEAVCAFVVLKDGCECDKNDLMRLCSKHLAAFKVPKEIRFIKALPKTESMKVKKEELKKKLSNPNEVA